MHRFLSVVGISLGAAGAHAAQFHSSNPLTIEQRAKSASQIAVVRADQVHTEKMRNEFGDELIVTRVRLSVKEHLKGRLQAAPEMIVEGGTLNGITLRVSDLPAIKAGDDMVVFLDPDRGAYRPHMRGRGILFLDKELRNVRRTSLSLKDIRSKVLLSAEGK